MRKCCRCGAEIEVLGDPPTEQLLCMDCFHEIKSQLDPRNASKTSFADLLSNIGDLKLEREYEELRREIKGRLQRNEWFLDGDEGVPVSVKPNEN